MFNAFNQLKSAIVAEDLWNESSGVLSPATSGDVVSITVDDTENAVPMTLVQNDTTNDPDVLSITNTGTGQAISVSQTPAGITGQWSTSTGFVMDIDDSYANAFIRTGDQSFYFGGWTTSTEREMGMVMQGEGSAQANAMLGAFALGGAGQATAKVHAQGSSASTAPSKVDISSSTGSQDTTANITIKSWTFDSGAGDAEVFIQASNLAGTGEVRIDAKTAINIGTDTLANYDGDINIGTNSASQRTVTIGAADSSKVDNLYLRGGNVVIASGTGGAVTIDGPEISIDATDTSNLSMSANENAFKVLSITAANADASGTSGLSIQSENVAELTTTANSSTLNVYSQGTGSVTNIEAGATLNIGCLLYTSPSPRD